MTPDQANAIVVGVAVAALVCVALAALIVAFALVRMARDVRRVTGSLNEVAAALTRDLPPTLASLRETSANLSSVSGELAPRLTRIDSLLDEADATVASLRATAETAEDLVRGPQAAMDRAKRGVRAAGEGLARGADSLRKTIEERTGRAPRNQDPPS